MRILGYMHIRPFFPTPVVIIATNTQKTFFMYPDGHNEDFDEYTDAIWNDQAFYREKAELLYEPDKICYMFSPDRMVYETHEKLILLLEQELRIEKENDRREILTKYIAFCRNKKPAS